MKKVKVVDYEFFSISGVHIPEDLIGANLFLEDGSVFTLYNIPKFIAMECMRLTNKLANDFRLSISEVLAEIPEIEKALSKNIEYIIIDDFDPELGVYSATIKRKGSGNRTVKVIPSHGLLLSIIGGIDIYVSKKLIRRGARGIRRRT